MTRVGLPTATTGPLQPGEHPPTRPRRRSRWRLLAPALAATAAGGLVALGQTTVVRSLETAAATGKLCAFDGESQLFIKPGFHFVRVTDLSGTIDLVERVILLE